MLSRVFRFDERTQRPNRNPPYIGGSMEFRGAAQTMTSDGQRRRDYLPGLSEAQRKNSPLLHRLPESAPQPASRLRDGPSLVAAVSGPH